jgi:hypothetical protein
MSTTNLLILKHQSYTYLHVLTNVNQHDILGTGDKKRVMKGKRHERNHTRW